MLVNHELKVMHSSTLYLGEAYTSHSSERKTIKIRTIIFNSARFVWLTQHINIRVSAEIDLLWVVNVWEQLVFDCRPWLCVCP